jgi:hypothetical protein
MLSPNPRAGLPLVTLRRAIRGEGGSDLLWLTFGDANSFLVWIVGFYPLKISYHFLTQ